MFGFARSESQWRQWQDVVEARPHPPLPESPGNDEGKLQGLGRIQPWVTVCVVAVTQVIEGHSP
jgi:hypothetical protein